MAEQQTSNEALDVLTDINTKLQDLDEKNSMLKERMLLLSQSFLKQEENLSKDISTLKEDIADIKDGIERMKEAINHIIHESENFARKDEMRTLDRYMKLWEPLKFMKEDEVKKMISDALKK